MTTTLDHPVSKNGKPKSISIPKIDVIKLSIHLVGDTPLISNRFSESSIDAMEAKHTQAAVAARGPKDPEGMARGSMYLLGDKPAHPSAAFKLAAIAAWTKGSKPDKKVLDLGFSPSTELVEIECRDMLMRRDAPRNANGSPDVRFRMEYRDWSCWWDVTIYPRYLSVEQVLQWVQMGGVNVGIGPQYMRKGFGFGRFHIEDAVQG